MYSVQKLAPRREGHEHPQTQFSRRRPKSHTRTRTCPHTHLLPVDRLPAFVEEEVENFRASTPKQDALTYSLECRNGIAGTPSMGHTHELTQATITTTYKYICTDVTYIGDTHKRCTHTSHKQVATFPDLHLRQFQNAEVNRKPQRCTTVTMPGRVITTSSGNQAGGSRKTTASPNLET